ncbi:MAG: hypothetical protein ACYDEV_02240 [Acidiferrobacter sp.]
MRGKVVILSFFAGCTISSAAFSAVPYTIIRAESGLSAAFGGLIQSYRETANGSTLDQETGTIPMITLGASSVSHNPQGGMYWRILGRYADGNTIYDGQLLNGTPAQTTTANTIFDINGRVGFANGIGHHMALIPYFEIGEHNWKRDIGSGQGAGGIEHYTNGYMGGGLLWEMALGRRWVLAAHGMAGYTFGAQITATDPVYVDNTTGQVSYATASEALGDSLYESGGIKATYIINHVWHSFIRVDATHFAYGASIAVPIFYSSGAGQNGYYEPNSSTTQVFVTAGVGARF